MGNLYIGYRRQEGASDLASQLHHVLGIYCTSRIYGCRLFHLHFDKVDEFVSMDEMLALNHFLSIKIDPVDISSFGPNIYYCNSPEPSLFEKLKSVALTSESNVALLMTHPFSAFAPERISYILAKNKIDRLSVARYLDFRPAEMCNIISEPPSGLVVGIHLPKYTPNGSKAIPNWSYRGLFGLCKNLLDATAELGIQCRFRVVVDAPTTSSEASSGELPMFDECSSESPRLSGEIGWFFDSVEATGSLEVCINRHPISALCNLALSDIVVIAESRLSYVAAIAGMSKIVVSADNIRPSLPSWLSWNGLTGDFERCGFLEIIRNSGIK